MRLLLPLAAAGVLLLLGSVGSAVRAQNALGFPVGQEKPVDPFEQQRRENIDQQYRARTSTIPEQKSNDPWANVRGAEQPQKPAASPPKRSTRSN